MVEQGQSDVRIGTAGWSIPRQHAAALSSEGSHLQRYARTFSCTEINSSFYRQHRPGTYERWAEATPGHFRFAVKTPRELTHEGGLAPNRERLQSFFEEVRGLGGKLGPILLQLPPKRSFEPQRARDFLQLLRELHPAGPVVLEPRHGSWFTDEADALLRSFHIARVAADPMCVPQAMTPAGDASILYYRLHGSPRTYYSSYADEFLANIAHDLDTSVSQGREAWCIFDNTASGAALGDALRLQARNGAGKQAADPSVADAPQSR